MSMELRRYAFGVCRIVPENNVHLILEAFAADPAMPLVMVGNWHSCDYGQDLLNRYQGNSHIELKEPIYDPAILDPLRRNCTVYLHGHSCGGTNPSLVEAMYCELPIIAFDVNFNRETTENQALYFKTAEELKALCNSFDDEKAAVIRKKMKEIADRRYTWERISDCYAKLF